MHPHINKQFIFFVSLTAVTLFTALIAITLSNDLRKKASDKYLTSQALASDQPLEINKISLGENPSTDSRSSLKDGKLQLTISKGALDPEASREQDLTFALLPANTDLEILRFSLNLSKSSEDKKDDSGIVHSQPNQVDEITPNQDAKTQYLDAQEEKATPAITGQAQLKFSNDSVNEKKNYYTLEYNFSELEELYAHSSLKFLWFNNQNSSWEEIPTTVDEANSKIIAQVDHLSDFAVSGQKAQVFSPTLKNWESSLYTGSVNYSFPVETVPGRGGLTPGLSVNYVSNRINSLSPEQKGSWLGPGWDLTLPEIRFDAWTEKSGTSSNCKEYAGTRKRGPQYSLILGGSEEPLYWIEDKYNNPFDPPISSKYISKGGIPVTAYYGTYKDHNRFDTDSCLNDSGRNYIITKWIAQGKDGQEYTFDSSLNNSVADRKIKNTMAPSKYMVTEIKDLSGNKIVFEYNAEVQTGHNITVYPTVIKYNFQGNTPFGAVEFTTTEKTYQPDFSARKPHEVKYEEMNFEKSRLSEIKVYSNYPQRTLYKTYKFNYDVTSYKYPYKYSGGWQETGYDTLTKVDTYQGEATDAHKFVPETFTYEMRTVGFQFIPLHDNERHSDWVNSCEMPWRHTVSWNNFKNWVVSNERCDPDRESNVPCLCEYERIQLANAGFEFCLGTNGIGDNGGESKPNNPQPGCPALAQMIGYYGGTTQGWVIGWETGKAPFIKKVNNGYGGEVAFSYENYINPKREYAYNRNVVTSKEMSDTNNPSLPTIRTEYTYDPLPVNETLRPEKGGGFHRVTSKDPVTNMLTTTYYYPLSPKVINEEVAVWDSLNDPEKNPFWGAPLRTIVHRYEGNQDLIYSDQFISYSFIPVYKPDFVNPSLASTFIAEGVGQRVTTTTDSFMPKTSNYVAANIDPNKPQYFDYNSDTTSPNPKFLHTQSRSWYDQYGYLVKTAQYGDIRGFAEISTGNDFSRRRDINGGWQEADKAKTYSFYLPMLPYLYDQGQVVSDPPSSGTPTDNPSLKKYSYTKYVRSSADSVYVNGADVSLYLAKNMTGLVAEAFASDQDAKFETIPETKRWSWSSVNYDADGKIRGLTTSSTQKNTSPPTERLKLKDGSDMPDTISSSISYDEFGNPITKTDARGNTSTTAYYPAGSPFANILPKQSSTQIKDAEGRPVVNSTSTTTYDPLLWLPTEVIDTNNLKSRTEYDCLGRTQNVYKPIDASVFGLASIPNATYIYFDYQAEGCGIGAVSTNKPLPHLRTKTRISATGPNGEDQQAYMYTDMISDGFGQTRETQVLKTKVNDIDKSLINETVYNNRGLKETESSVWEYDPINLTSDTSPLPQYIPIFDPELTRYTYDELGRATTVTDPLNHTTRTEYSGLVTRAFDANNSYKTPGQNPTYTQSETNGLGQTVKTITANISTPNQPAFGLMSIPVYNNVLGAVESATQYKCNNPACSDGNNSSLFTSRTYYDHLGRKWKTEDPDLGIWKYAYDANGNFVRQEDAKNQTINFYYDSLNRLVKKEYPGNPRGGLPVSGNKTYIQYTYDLDGTKRFIGKKLKMTDLTGETSYEYDSKGRLIKENKNIDKALYGLSGFEETQTEYEYYDSDTLKSTKLPNGETVNQVINTSGQLTAIKNSIKDPATQQTTSYDLLKQQQYNKFGMPTTGLLGNSVVSEKTYDQLGRVKTISAKKDTNILMNYDYADRDDVGNITSVSNNPQNLSLTYNYDSLYQLTHVNGNYQSRYEYDAEGNILSKKDGNETVAMQYTDISHRHAPKIVNGFTYRYDANGNLLEDEERTYEWDFDNKPVRIAMKKTGTVTEFAYDGDGNRVMKRTSEESHYACADKACKKSPGAGSNTCSSDADCLNYTSPTPTPSISVPSVTPVILNSVINGGFESATTETFSFPNPGFENGTNSWFTHDVSAIPINCQEWPPCIEGNNYLRLAANTALVDPFTANNPFNSTGVYYNSTDKSFVQIANQGNNIWAWKYNPEDRKSTSLFKWSLEYWKNKIDWKTNNVAEIAVNIPADSWSSYFNPKDSYYYTVLTQGTDLWVLKYKLGEKTVAQFKWSFSEWISRMNWNNIEPLDTTKPLDDGTMYYNPFDDKIYHLFMQTDQNNNSYVWETNMNHGDSKSNVLYRKSLEQWSNDTISWEANTGIPRFDTNKRIDSITVYENPRNSKLYLQITQGTGIWQFNKSKTDTKYLPEQKTSTNDWLNTIDWGKGKDTYLTTDWFETGTDASNQTFAVSFKAKSHSGAITIPHMLVQRFPKDGVDWKDVGVWLGNIDLVDSEFRNIERIVTMPNPGNGNSTSKIRIVLRPPYNDTMPAYFDDVKISKPANISGWNFYNGFDAQWNSYSADNQIPHSGTKSLKMTVILQSGNKQSYATMYQDLSSLAGKTVIISGWIKTDGSPDAAGYIGYKNDSDNQTALSEKVNSTSWTKIEKEFNLPAGKNISLRLEGRGPGNVWFDDIAVVEKSSSSPPTPFYRMCVNQTCRTYPGMGESNCTSDANCN